MPVPTPSSDPNAASIRAGSPEPTPHLDARLDTLARRTRWQRALEASPPVALGLGAGLSCVILAYDLRTLSAGEAVGAAALGVSAALGIVVLAALRPVDRLRLAVAVDRALGLRGRLGNALALAGDPSELARLARRDAERRAESVEPARVLPYRRPRGLLGGVALLAIALILLGIGPIEPRVERRASGEEGARLTVAEVPASIDPDALAALRERMAEARHEGEVAPEAQALTDALNALIEEVAAGEVTEDEALARIAELEAELDRGASARSAEIQRELADAARQMREARSTEALARALTEGQLEEAARELRAMAQRTRTEPPPRELIENLRAMAQDRERAARERELEEAEEENERLLQRRREREERGETPPEEEERLLEQRQRELDRLRREHEARQDVERELDRLRRELDDASQRMEEEHRRPSEAGGDAMERAAEELSRHAREQQSAEQMQELARELQRLREALREAQRSREEGGEESGQGRGHGEGQDGEEGGQGARMRRFVLRAGGGDDGEGASIGVRRPGGQSGEGGEEGEGEGPSGRQPGQGGEPGEGGEQPGGQSGQGAGEQGEMLVLGEGGDAVLEIPGLGAQGGEGPPQRGGEGEGEGSGQGSGHDPSSLDDPSQRLAGARAVRVEGQPGSGPSRSQVIRGASSEGFASRDYERVYEEYASHAEEAVERDRVPPGYRSYVQRYFELIRPRADARSTEGP